MRTPLCISCCPRCMLLWTLRSFLKSKLAQPESMIWNASIVWEPSSQETERSRWETAEMLWPITSLCSWPWLAIVTAADILTLLMHIAANLLNVMPMHRDIVVNKWKIPPGIQQQMETYTALGVEVAITGEFLDKREHVVSVQRIVGNNKVHSAPSLAGRKRDDISVFSASYESSLDGHLGIDDLRFENRSRVVAEEM